MYNINDIIREYGYVKLTKLPNLKLRDEILRLKQEKNVVILGHYYIEGELQDISDFVGDSLALAQQAAKTKADIILFLGVHFMAETAKILNPEKKVLLPDLNAGCSLADSCPTNDFAAFLKNYPNHTVISYINTTAEIKALTDIICTSSNAVQIVQSLPPDEKIVFGPDKNLGNYIRSLTGRDMVIWDGACHVHQQFSVERIIELKNEYPDAHIIAHPECNKPVLVMADYIGSTSALLKYTQTSTAQRFIIATESGILHQMRLSNPDKMFIPAPPDDATCACNDCNFMKLNTLEKVYQTLVHELPEIQLNKEISDKAYKPIKRMLDISATLGL